MLKVCIGPGQLLRSACTEIVALIVEAPELVVVKLGKLPVPFAAKPIAVLEFVH